ncbi:MULTISPECIES: hypothetical protein [unclassified Enterobacter]|uniref:hypothetical protein n=1 Tax=unclassified Enterobacter TaxID=2608935 RepID=UPI0011CE7A89|nr:MULTISPECIES: hypothetical protein [unclassified Enterobacter]
MKITVDSINQMFEGTRQLLLGGLITAITGVLIVWNNESPPVGRLPIMFSVVALLTILPGFIAMLFSPITPLAAKLFDIKGSIVLCRIFSFIYFILYWYVTLLVVNIIFTIAMGLNGNDTMLKICFIIGCFIVAVVQTRRFYRLITQ